MPDSESLIPEVTDDDIKWAQSLMGLDDFDEPRRDFLKNLSTVDLSACPGSGKTTLIVAKLAILAQKWPHRTKGICVLSHTNVAREQIEYRLGRTVVGQRVLAYPHFVDTIHGFVNRFLALPWLYSNGCPSPTIDDDVTTAYRRGVLREKNYGLEIFLSKKRADFEQLRVCNRNLKFVLSGKPFPANPSTPSYQNVKHAIESTARAGYFCYDEMFVWADALLEDYPNFPEWLAHRFPLVIVDEMQDTSKRQISFLNTVFPRDSNKIIVQRVGDPNQEIFEISDVETNGSDAYPDSSHTIEIPNSYRFGNKIATLVSPFAVQPVGTEGLSGIGPKGLGATVKECKHAIFIFPDHSTAGVLDAFGNHVLDELGDILLTQEGSVHAVGHVHKIDAKVALKEEHYPKSVGHYWDAYCPEISRKNPYPRTLVQYVRVAQGLVTSGRTLSSGVEKIASGTIELARRIGEIGDLHRKARTHRAVMNALEEDMASLKTYQDLLRTILVERIALSEDDWLSLKNDFTTVASAICDSEPHIDKAKKFLDWPKDDLSLSLLSASSGGIEPNVLRVSNQNRTINIRLGSIHSVKGQTHVATLLLNTFWHGHSAKHIMPWLLGQKINGAGARPRDKQRLLNTYVAMTRPSHLLCLALPHSALGLDQTAEKNIATLMSIGWHIAEIVDGKANWRE